jgi:hypothetical protein
MLYISTGTDTLTGKPLFAPLTGSANKTAGVLAGTYKQSSCFEEGAKLVLLVPL